MGSGKSRSLVHLAVVDGFEKNVSRRRAYRVGIDASIWFHHAAFSKGGENWELRTLFFRLISLLKLPILPLFVFDGRERPKVKRGSRLGKSGSHALSKNFKEFLDAFGIEWREARGEAEAELAYLNQKDYIDAIMSDDCDVFIFGACTVIKNMSVKLSGNRNNPALNLENKKDAHHVMLYTAEAVKDNTEIALTRGGLVLFALLSGGDYHKGVGKVGKALAHGLARCGFGDQLLEAYSQPPGAFATFLFQWRSNINSELRDNSRGFLPHKYTMVLPDDFPDLDVLEKYANPLNNGQPGSRGCSPLRDKGSLDLGRIAGLCEKYFEWGYTSEILKRFRSMMWPAAVMNILRRAVLEADEKEQKMGNLDAGSPLLSRTLVVGTPASLIQKYLGRTNQADITDRYAEVFVNPGPQTRGRQLPDVPDPFPLIRKVVGTRRHASTDYLLEYQVEIIPSQLVTLTQSGIRGIRPEPSQAERGTKKSVELSDSSLLLWIPASVLCQVHPAIIEDFASSERPRKRKIKGASATEEKSSLGAVSGSSVESEINHGFLFSFPDPGNISIDEGDSVDDDASIDGIELDDSNPCSKLDRLFDQILDAPLKACSVKRRPEQRELEMEKPPKRHKTNKSTSPAPSYTRRVEPITYGADIPDLTDSDDDLPSHLLKSSSPRRYPSHTRDFIDLT